MYKSILKPTLVLVAICIVVSALLSITYNAAGIKNLGKGIAQSDLDTYKTTVLPNASSLKLVNVKSDNKDFISAYKDEGGNGSALYVQSKGYGGELKLLVGLDKDGKITGIQVVESQETPGLGAKVSESDFTSQFVGKSGDVKVGADGGEIEAIAGATISSRAFCTAVDTALTVYNEIKGEL